ncbi:MAG: hypothetical protein NVSMB17_15820 [Candidatus Dormibacteria bacterium]
MKAADNAAMKTKTLVLTASALVVLVGCGTVATPAATRAAAVISEPPAAPANLTATASDHNAVLAWNGFPRDDAGSTDVTGYRVTWGRAGSPASAQVLTARATAQLQPLENGVDYEATVEALSADGRLSPPSASIHFTGDGHRVEALRSRMNGFFDDFTRPAGFPDATRWNFATSACNNPAGDGFFVNAQFHAHNQLASGSACVKAQSVSRPRAVFDFTGRTGTIAFDLDGAQRSDQWYLDLVPNLIDINGQVGVEEGLDRVGDRGKNRFAPGSVLRLHQSGQDVEIIWIDERGYEHLLARGDAEKNSVPLLPNVRRAFEVHVGRRHADISIDGHAVAATDALDLPFTRAHLLWNTFSYDTRGNSNEAAFLLHWGNFGFDAPPGTTGPVIHDYTDGSVRAGATEVTDASVMRHVRIPDSIEGPREARLMLTLQAAADGYEWAESDAVIINGVRLPIPMPRGAGLAAVDIVTDESPYAVVLAVPAGVLTRGDNQVEVRLHQASFLNLHTELEFAPGSAGEYTPPPTIAGLVATSASPTAVKVGPGVTLDTLGSLDTAHLLRGTKEEVAKRPAVRAAGRQPVTVSFQDEAALNGTGKNPGVRSIDFIVDGHVVESRRVDQQAPAVAGTVEFMFDTRTLADGSHTIEARGTGADGVASIPDYDTAGTSSGEARSLRIEVLNHPAWWRSLPGIWGRI